jgi:uncharacterized protein YbjT (DUF2867 family)
MDTQKSIIMLGATGAVGTETIKTLSTIPNLGKLTLLGRRPFESVKHDTIENHKVDIFDPSTYSELISGYDIGICTLGVGEPSKVSKEQFVKIDKTAVLDFAKACKLGGVTHFQLLASVGINANSRSFYLRIKGELVGELKALNFDRLSIFQPSMIITPTNRYGVSQALILAIWPIIDKVFFGALKKYKGVKVSNLGSAIANNITRDGGKVEMLYWDDFEKINKK